MDYIKLKPYVETVNVWSKVSTCCRMKVGALLIDIKDKRMLSIGYNGSISGVVHCDELFDFENLLVCDEIENYLSGTLFNYSGNYTFIYNHNTNKRCLKFDDEKYLRDLHHKFSEKYEVHAEQNAIYSLLKQKTNVESFDDVCMVVTHEPCFQCAKMIAALGIKHIFYINEYDRNIERAFDFFNKMGSICRQIEE